MPAEPKHFVNLFNHPTVEGMYALSPKEFERFVAYVLPRAGYVVKEVGPHFLRGVDLEMRLPTKMRIFGGVECKKYAPGHLVRAPVVAHVLGAAAVSRQGNQTICHHDIANIKDVPNDVFQHSRNHLLTTIVRFYSFLQL